MHMSIFRTMQWAGKLKRFIIEYYKLIKQQ